MGGIGGFIWESFYVTQTLTAWFIHYNSANNVYIGVDHGIIPALIVALLAFISLTLPGIKLKKLVAHVQTIRPTTALRVAPGRDVAAHRCRGGRVPLHQGAEYIVETWNELLEYL